MKLITLSALRGIEDLSIPDYLFVVMDVLRASTTIVTLMERGAEQVRIAGTLDEAHRLKRAGYTIIGERGDRRPEGFHFDNSPYAVSTHSWYGRKIALTTTNGTRALLRVRDGREVLVACFRNLTAVANHATELGFPTALVPAGNAGRPRLEDELCAQSVRRVMLGAPLDWASVRDKISKRIAPKLRARGDPYRRDVNFALAANTTRLVPVLGNDLTLRCRSS